MAVFSALSVAVLIMLQGHLLHTGTVPQAGVLAAGHLAMLLVCRLIYRWRFNSAWPPYQRRTTVHTDGAGRLSFSTEHDNVMYASVGAGLISVGPLLTHLHQMGWIHALQVHSLLAMLVALLTPLTAFVAWYLLRPILGWLLLLVGVCLVCT